MEFFITLLNSHLINCRRPQCTHVRTPPISDAETTIHRVPEEHASTTCVIKGLISSAGLNALSEVTAGARLKVMPATIALQAKVSVSDQRETWFEVATPTVSTGAGSKGFEIGFWDSGI